jgi:D-serine deaminase-like pyridoxal phosphate-dependent protein
VATVWEAAVLAATHRILVAVDDAVNIAALSAAAVRAGAVLGVMVEVDTGIDRYGADTPGPRWSWPGW